MIRLLSAIVVATGALAGLGPGTAVASTCVSWTGSQPTNPNGSGDVLTGVSALRPCDV